MSILPPFGYEYFHRWDVVNLNGYWIALIGPHYHVSVSKIDRIPWEIAVDATLDFMDRCRTRRVPRGVTDPKELMSICLRASRRQR